MSTPPVPKPYRTYSDNMWYTYITEAIQSGDHKEYCRQHNIPYRTFNNKYAEYNKSSDKENWSPKSKRRYSHRVFTDSTEKQAHAEWRVKYDDTPLCSDSNDLSAILMKIHNTKYPDKPVINVARSTLSRFKQQFNIGTKRTSKRKHNMIEVDDDVLTSFQSKLNDVFIEYENRDLILNSDLTRVPQSDLPTTTLCTKGKPANKDTGVNTNHRVGAMCTCTASGNVLPIMFLVPVSQVNKFEVCNPSTQQHVHKRAKQIKQNITM